MSLSTPAPLLELPRDAKGKPTARIILSNDPFKNKHFKYKKNEVSTGKYNLITFIPKNLFEQFSRIANLYFLFLLILQLIPQIRAFSVFSVAFPLVFVLLISAVKDGVDDWNRHKSDREVNNREVLVIRGGRFVTVEWHSLLVGDIIRIHNNENVPCDTLVLSSGLENAITYVETAELDGETNLKLKSGLPATSNLKENDYDKFQATVTCEAPNIDLHKYSGKVRIQGEAESMSINNDNLLLRGMKVRNCPYVDGLVIFAGHETKLMMNAAGSRFKRTQMDDLMNTLVLYIFLLLLVLCFISSVALGIHEDRTGRGFQIYLPWDSTLTSPAVIAIVGFFTFISLYNGLIPISLYVSVEIIRLGQSWLIDWDAEMYCPLSNTPAKARTTTLNEELGQIDYIFSDKTGTLTQNVMRFMKCSIGGVSYGKGETEASIASKVRKGLRVTDDPVEYVDFSANKYAEPQFEFVGQDLYDKARAEEPEIHRFFRLLAICHTVQIEYDNGSMGYAAQSPDEQSLVSAARNFGYVYKALVNGVLTIEINGKDENYEIMNILEFNSDRKRMSVIARCPDGQIRIFTKGADNIITPRCVKNEELLKATENHLEEYATDGLRTLMIAERVIDKAVYEEWNTKVKEANLELDNREEKVDLVNELIENQLELIGATAIEDRLQDNVPRTISNLRNAGIKIWVLTGDKQETAINIGFACQLLHNDQHLFVLNENSKASVLAAIQGLKEQCEHLRNDREKALVIDGPSLVYALDEDIKLELLDLASVCRAVVCCRVTPLQKATVVNLVKENKKAITLAIGDGANDVSMIQAAHIGVGISGLEGRQAVLASDYSIAQFRFLERLLLVHGRWSYMRMSKFLRYFFYKNFAFTFVQFWFAINNGFSGQSIYDSWFLTFYNIIFTSLPILAVGIFEKDVNDVYSLKHPEMYVVGQEGRLFNKQMFFKYCLMLGTIHSILLYTIPFGVWGDMILANGQTAGYDAFSATISATLVVVVTLTLALDIFNWTFVNHIFVWCSAIIWFFYGWYLYVIPQLVPSVPFYGVMFLTQNQASFWFTLIITTFLCLVPIVIWKYLHNQLQPTVVDVVREQAYITQLQKKIDDKQGIQVNSAPLTYDDGLSEGSIPMGTL